MSPQIQDPDLSERLRRKFQIVGSSSIDTIAPELVGVVVVDSLLPSVSRRSALMTVEITISDAGDIPEISLVNLDPVASLVIEEFWIGGNTAGTYRFRTLGVQGTLVAGGVIAGNDLRGPLLVPAITPTAVDLNALGGGGTRLWQGRLSANVTVHVITNTVLAPAGTLIGAIPRDVVHWDNSIAASRLAVAARIHFEDPAIGPGS